MYALFFTALALADPAVEERLLPIGYQDLLPGSIQASFVQDSGVLHLEAAEAGIVRVLALRKGDTNLFLAGDRSIHYQVLTASLYRRLGFVRQLLSDVPGIRVDPLDDMIVIRGQPANTGDTEKILNVQAAYVDDVLNLAVANPHLCDAHRCRPAPEERGVEGAIVFGEDPIAMAVRAPASTASGATKLKKHKKLRSISDPN